MTTNNTKDHPESSWTQRLRERDRNRRWTENRLLDLDYPGLYLGDELNTFHFDWDRAVREETIDGTWRIALINLIASQYTFAAPAVMLFYEQLHACDPDWVVERSLCPPSENDQNLMKEDGIRPFAVESKMPLEAFDAVCLSMDLSNSGAAVPWLLLESGIPICSTEREQKDPFVIMGGSALVNPEPYRAFCDILFLGEGEELLPQLLRLLRDGRRKGLPRDEILLDAARQWDCVYVPRFYEERYDRDGRFAGTFPLRKDIPDRLRFYRVKDLDRVFLSSRPFLNFCTNAADTSHYEISRGCEGKCSFCMGGFTSLPFRPRSAALIRENTRKIIRETGNTFFTPVSFNSVSHPEINQIVRDLSGTLGDKIRFASLRMDGFHNNPELCCFISMQKRGRIAFGVEGASQRLRDLVSKNLSEEQILDTMREVCRRRYGIVKFMMICNLPTETEADLDELYELAVKIRDIFEQESLPGERIPRLLITWTSLIVSPHTPLQWARVNRSLPSAYAEFTERIRKLGFRTYTPEITADDLITQLFLRGDGRLSGLLRFLAEEGHLRHNDPYGEEVYEKTIRFLKENGLPSLEEWFREYDIEDPLPWDIVASPASKDYLYRRYLAMKQARPTSDPICSEGCSGCGACDAQHQRLLQGLPALRKADWRINLHHPVRGTAFRPVQFVLLEFTFDCMHAVVIPSYWDCEIRRALFHTGILFDPDSVECFGSREYADHAAAGPNVTNISLGEKVDPEQLKRRIADYAVNFRVRSVRETDKPLRAVTASYRMHLPKGTDSRRVPALLQAKLSEEEWFYGTATKYAYPRNLRHAVQKLDVLDGDLLITMGPRLADPRLVYRYLFDLPVGSRLGQMPERIGFSFENKGILDLALTREARDAYLRHLEETTDRRDRPFEDAAAYISGSMCVTDLYKLIQREYRNLPDYHLPKYLPGLIEFVKKDHRTDDDPAYSDMMDFLAKKNEEGRFPP